MDDRELLDVFTDMVRIHTAYVDRQLMFVDLSIGQGAVITALGKNGPLTQNELARFRQVAPATISVMLGRMERDGLVTRVNQDKGRANTVTLTERGLSIYKKLNVFMESEPGVVFDGLNDEEKGYAMKIFRKISDNLEE